MGPFKLACVFSTTEYLCKEKPKCWAHETGCSWKGRHRHQRLKHWGGIRGVWDVCQQRSTGVLRQELGQHKCEFVTHVTSSLHQKSCNKLYWSAQQHQTKEKHLSTVTRMGTTYTRYGFVTYVTKSFCPEIAQAILKHIAPWQVPPKLHQTPCKLTNLETLQ